METDVNVVKNNMTSGLPIIETKKSPAESFPNYTV